MTLSATDADNLDALAAQLGAATGPDPSLDSQFYNLVVGPMQELQQRTAPAGFLYTLNVTNALHLRAKQWYMRNLGEIGEPNQPFAGCEMTWMPTLGSIVMEVNANGATIALATAAAICKSWAYLIRHSLGLVA